MSLKVVFFIDLLGNRYDDIIRNSFPYTLFRHSAINIDTVSSQIQQIEKVNWKSENISS